jgi:hypothetical protein
MTRARDRCRRGHSGSVARIGETRRRRSDRPNRRGVTARCVRRAGTRRPCCGRCWMRRGNRAAQWCRVAGRRYLRCRWSDSRQRVSHGISTVRGPRHIRHVGFPHDRVTPCCPLDDPGSTRRSTPAPRPLTGRSPRSPGSGTRAAPARLASRSRRSPRPGVALRSSGPDGRQPPSSLTEPSGLTTVLSHLHGDVHNVKSARLS